MEWQEQKWIVKLYVTVYMGKGEENGLLKTANSLNKESNFYTELR